MNISNNLKPIVLYEKNRDRITMYYGSFLATGLDGYDPNAVLRVCEGKQKTHKGKVFCFLDDFGILGDRIQADIMKRKGGENLR